MSESVDINGKEIFKVVFSFKMAEQLCVDYPFLSQLVSIQQSHKNPNRRVWVFKRSPEFDKTFEELRANAIKAREERNQ